MRHLPIALLLALSACGHSNAPVTTDPTNASTERVGIHPVHHASMVLTSGKTVIYVDPYEGAERFKAYPQADVVLITDIHPDHLDSATLAGLDLTHARFVVPQAVLEKLPKAYRKQAQVLANGARADVNGVGIEAVPMYNLPGPHEQFHTKGRGNGYVLTSASGERIYISGDTEDIPEMRALKNIDVAFVCMNQPYTMTVDQAANAVSAFKPKVVYPYHYRGQDGMSDVKRFKELVNAGDPHIEVKQEDWYK